MTPEEAARATGAMIGDLPSRFMLDGETYRHGASLGFDGVDFYVVGRGGALGAVNGAVVAAAFVFFNAEAVAERWERGVAVMPPGEAARAFASVGHAWAQQHLDEGATDYVRLADLAGKLVDRADGAGAPLFAGWRCLPEPSEPRALVVHRVNALRELRAARHGAAVLSEGLEPVAALSVRTPAMAAVFGWTGELPDAELHRPAWERAEQTTDRMMARVMASLEATERAEFTDLLGAAARQ